MVCAACQAQWAGGRVVDSQTRWCPLERCALAAPCPFWYLVDVVLRNFSDGLLPPAGMAFPLACSHIA